MRKPRDYNAELAALDQRARQLRDKHLRQLGELVVATGADTLGPEELAGALLAALSAADPAKKEAWRKRGTAFFSGGRARGQARTSAAPQPDDAAPSSSTAASDHAQPGAA